mgnify:CR=1 FL=1
MKRFLLFLALLCVLRVQAQQYSMEYWFDQRYADRNTAVCNTTEWQMQLDVSQLNDGLHTLYLHLRDTAGHYSPPQSFLFYKSFVTDSTGYNMAYSCWFDEGYTAAQQTGTLTNGNMLLEVGNLKDGLHTMNMQIGNGLAAELHSYLFYKVSASDSIGFANIAYTCWIDENHTALQTGTLGDGNILLDVSNLQDGLHTMNIQIGDGLVAELHSYLFYKVSAYDSTGSTNLAYICWFDNDNTAHQTGTLSNGIILLDVSSLTDGLHTVNMQIGNGLVAELHSYLFYKVPVYSEAAYSLDYTCWFDHDFANRQSGTLSNGTFLLEVSDLGEGLHTMNMQIGAGAVTELHSYLFYKAPVYSEEFYALDYTCWFDQGFDNCQSGTLSNGTFLLEVSDLGEGLHTMNMQIGTGAAAELHSYLFYRITTSNALADTAVLRYHYAIDGRQKEPIEVSPQGGAMHLMLDVADVPIGLHTLSCFLMTSDGSSSTLHTAFFYKTPNGGNGINRYEYWLNGDMDARHTIDVPSQDTFHLISLLPVDTLPLRSMCFEFDPNNGSPVIYAKNEVTFRFWNAEHRFTSATKQYVDENVMQVVVADTLERDTTKVIPAPNNNAIHWFKLAAGTGDSLSFHTDRRCTMQLYAPSGAMVFHTSGDTVLTWHGCHAWEDGDYYLAVHDAEGNGTVAVSYQWLYRYAVLAWDVHRVGNGGISTITFEGNGFDNLDTVFLIKGTDTIPTLFLDHESNTTIGIVFNFEGADTGMYNAVFVYVDETLPVSNAVWVETALPIVLTSNVSYPSTFLRGSTVTYTYEITNTGNMTAYNVPLFIYYESPTIKGISRVKIDGLDLVSILDGINLNSISVSERTELQQWAEDIGDEHFFLRMKKGVEGTTDSVIARSNFFYFTLSPFETKVITINMTSSEQIQTWITAPDSLPPMLFTETQDTIENNSKLLLFTDVTAKSIGSDIRDWYCCVRERTECMLDRVAYCFNRISLFGTDAAVVLGAAGLISFNYELLPVAGGVLAVSQAFGEVGTLTDLFSTNSKIYGNVICGDQNVSLLDAIRASVVKENKSVVNTLGNSILSYSDLLTGNFAGTVAGEAIHIQETMAAAERGVTSAMNTYLYGEGNQPDGLYQCMAFKEISPDCFPTEPQGGQSNPYVPVDPNEITGYIAESGSLAVCAEQLQLPYMIEFENDSTLASGMAHTVVVKDTLDGSVFDLNSFAVSSFAIGEDITTINGGQTFIRTMDMRPEINVIAQVQLDYLIDTTFAIATWTFSSLDPMTLQPTETDTFGFLAVGGTGEVNFTINRKANLSDSTLIDNRAWITFDNEDPIATSTWRNIMDVIPPTSHINSVAYDGETAIVSIVASDNLSGVWRYNLYAQLGDDVLLPVVTNIPADSIVSFVPPAETVRFHSSAVDSAGNIESVAPIPLVFYDTLFATVCDSFVWHDSVITTSGEYVWSKIYVSPSITDTITTLFLTVNYSSSLSETLTVCDNYTWNDSVYTESGDYTQTFTNASGCDSIVTLHLTVNYSNTGDTTAIVCDSFDWYEHTNLTQSGEYTHTFTNMEGCDSIVTLHLTMNYSNTGDTAAIACDSFDWYGTSYTSSGDYTHTLTNTSGCDSVVTLHLTVNYSNTGDTTAVACDSFDWYEHSNLTLSGDYTHTITNAAGCDSVVTLHLTVNHSNIDDTTAVACDSFDWYEHTNLTLSGDYTHTFTSVTGCDSVVTLHLTVNSSYHADLYDESCNSYEWYDVTYTESGEYEHLFTTVGGCDSVEVLHLSIHENVYDEFSVETDSCYTWNGISYCTSGDYIQTLQNVHGCDSVVTLHLTVTVGIEDYHMGIDMLVYPNPTPGILNVKCTINDEQLIPDALYVVDAYGKTVVIVTLPDASTQQAVQIDLSDLARGVYFLKAVKGEKVLATRKVVRG